MAQLFRSTTAAVRLLSLLNGPGHVPRRLARRACPALLLLPREVGCRPMRRNQTTMVEMMSKFSKDAVERRAQQAGVEPGAHGPVPERFMRHHYGPSGGLNIAERAAMEAIPMTGDAAAYRQRLADFQAGYAAGMKAGMERAADIADSHASIEGIAQKIAAAIRAQSREDCNGRLGDWAVICIECAKTHETIVRPRYIRTPEMVARDRELRDFYATLPRVPSGHRLTIESVDRWRAFCAERNITPERGRQIVQASDADPCAPPHKP